MPPAGYFQYPPIVAANASDATLATAIWNDSHTTKTLYTSQWESGLGEAGIGEFLIFNSWNQAWGIDGPGYEEE